MQIRYEQIAFRTNDIRAHASELQKRCAAAPWIYDLVDAVHLFAAEPRLGDSFQVELAFNYTLFPDKELELIQLKDGMTVQLPLQVDAGFAEPTLMNTQVLSHFGYHLPDLDGEATQDQQMVTELQEWIRQGYKVRQLSQTVVHKGTRKRYRYAFADTRRLIGAWTKIIQRLSFPSNEESIARGREAFTWLNDQV